MLERLEVHGKVYEPISVVAEGVTYSEEELTELVQAKLVPAAMIDNQWFVDRAAVLREQQVRPSDAEKRKQVLRKVERADAIKTVYATNKPSSPHETYATSLQAGAVVACGLLVGSLLYWSDQAGVDALALEAGVWGASEAFLEGVKPVWSTWQGVFNSAWYE